MRNLIAPKYSSRNFTYTPNHLMFGGTFTIEMSELQAIGGIQQVWSNSSDAGFVIVSAKTGNEAIFICTEIKMDSQRDIMYWVLSPTFSSYNKPGCEHLQHITVKVFNT